MKYDVKKNEKFNNEKKSNKYKFFSDEFKMISNLK